MNRVIILRSLLLIFFSCIFHKVLATGEPALVMGLGEVKSLQNSSQILFYNPAIFINSQATEIGTSFSNDFCIKELSTSHLYGSLGSNLGTFNGGFERFGSELFNRNRLVLGYANRWNKLAIGVNFNYLAVHIINCKIGQMVYSQIGTKVFINEHFTMAFSVANIEQSKINVEESALTIPTEMLLGLKWSDNKMLTLYFEAEKSLNCSLIGKFGAEIKAHKIFVCRLGCFGSPLTPTAGFGLMMKRVCLDMGFNFNSQLGISSSASLLVSF